MEDADERNLMRCEYRVISQDKPISAFVQAVNAMLERDDSASAEPSKKYYFCVLCQYEYYGFRCCPACKQHIYSTEVKDIDMLTVPVTFAK